MAALERLRHLAPLGPTATPAAQQAAEPPAAAAEPAPTLLSDAQMQSYVQNGYVALPVTDMAPEWHQTLWQSCHDWLFRGETEPQSDSRWVFPDIPELSDVICSPTVRGALTSILGPDYVQHPHRTMHNYGPANGLQETIGSDQTWVRPPPPPPQPQCLSARWNELCRSVHSTRTATTSRCAPTTPAG